MQTKFYDANGGTLSVVSKKVAKADNSVTLFLLSETEKNWLNFHSILLILWELLARSGIFELVITF